MYIIFAKTNNEKQRSRNSNKYMNNALNRFTLHYSIYCITRWFKQKFLTNYNRSVENLGKNGPYSVNSVNRVK